jgi:uncharacterized protein (DUF1810 family)
VEDPFDLERFVLAQDANGTYHRALEELGTGFKQTHWMWFVFPQVAGLGQSSTSRKYAISSLAEAEAYLRHPVLGPACGERERCSRPHRAQRRPDIRRDRQSEAQVIHDTVPAGGSGGTGVPGSP